MNHDNRNLRELEARVTTLETAVAHLQARLAAADLAGAPTGVPPATSTAWEHEARLLAAGGDKIQAVKLVREATGWGLRQAKDYVDRLGF